MAVPGLRDKVYEKALHMTEYLVSVQGADGAWRYCFESGILTDAYMIILLRHLDMDGRNYVSALAERIISRQEESGAWKLFYDEPEGNLSATIEAYYALLLSGFLTEEAPAMKRARDFILKKGGIPRAGSLTRVMLAVTGHYPWERMPSIPVELVLLPIWAPVNFFDLVGYTRVHAAPVLICADRKYAHKLPGDADLSGLYPSHPAPAPDLEPPLFLRKEINKLIKNTQFPVPAENNPAIQELESFMLSRTEGDGTLYTYFTATFLMIFALLALGYGERHPTILKAVEGLKHMACYAGGPAGVKFHQQEATSEIWDTALISYALQQTCHNVRQTSDKAACYLLARQQTRSGDWKISSPCGHPGGWGFSGVNTINPDVDDTSYTLRALARHAAESSETVGPLWGAGLGWLLDMQNDDGGWPAFERNKNKKWPYLLPMPDASSALTDPSSADLTGRALELLGNYAGIAIPHKQALRGAQWLLDSQRPDGSWYGRWGICFIYGTWAAVTGLLAVGARGRHTEKAADWLISIQNPDGGWGESCLSDSAGRYIPLGFSTPSQTAWALDALLCAGRGQNPAVVRGLEALLELVDKNGVEAHYPTGQGLPGGFYINYHSYRYVWPLVAFGHFLRLM